MDLFKEQGSDGFKRADAFEILEHSLPANMTNTQKLTYISHMLRAMATEELLQKNEQGKAWTISNKGKFELDS